MQPKKIAALQQAAVCGPIVILLASKSICSALIVTSSNNVQHVHFPRMNLQIVELYADLPRALSRSNFDIRDFFEARGHGECVSDQSDLKARLWGGREGLVNMSPDDIFRRHLADIWETIVKPVFEVLNLKASCHVYNLYVHNLI
jgi:hypothetical protein